MLTTSLLSTSALSATTEEKFAACDAALYAKVKEVQLCNLGVELRTSEIERLQKQNADLLDRGTAWHQNPFLWATLGVFLGVYAGARATR